VNGQGPSPEYLGGRHAMGTGTCIVLIAAGAILRYAVTTTSSHGVNVHVVGLIVMLAGVLGLLLSLLMWGALNQARRRTRDSAGYESTAPPPLAERERRTYRDEQPR
jgi:hypothetical protein